LNSPDALDHLNFGSLSRLFEDLKLGLDFGQLRSPVVLVRSEVAFCLFIVSAKSHLLEGNVFETRNTRHILGESKARKWPHSRFLPDVHLLAYFLDDRWRIGGAEIRIVGRRRRRLFRGGTFVTRQCLKAVAGCGATECGGGGARSDMLVEANVAI